MGTDSKTPTKKSTDGKEKGTVGGENGPEIANKSAKKKKRNRNRKKGKTDQQKQETSTEN